MDSANQLHKLNEYFSGCLYFTAGRLFRTVDRMAAESFRRLNIYPTHAFLIMALYESPGQVANPSYLAKVMNLDRSTITRLIATLEKQELVQRVRSGRTIAVQLSDRGESMLPDIQECWKDLYRRYCAELGQELSDEINRHIGRFLFEKNKTGDSIP